MKKKLLINSLFYNNILVISIIFSLVNIILHNSNDFEINQWILSLLFTICLGVSIKLSKYIGNYSIKVVLIVMLIRYSILPFSYYLTGITGLKYMQSVHYEYSFKALIVMCYEMIMVFLFMNIYAKKYLTGEEHDFKSTNDFSNVGNIIIMGLLILVFIIFPQFFSHLFVFSFEDNLGVDIDTSLNGLYVIIYRVALICLYCILISKISNQKGKKFFIISLIVTIFFIWITSQSASGQINRTVIIVNGLTFLLLFAKKYKEKKRLIFLYGGVFVLIIILLGTMVRFSYNNSSKFSTTLQNMSISLFDYGTLCSYFGGVENVTNSLYMIKEFRENITYKTFFNDVFYSFPYFGSRFVDFSNSTPVFFNIVYHRDWTNTSQIIPYIGQGVAYFGYILSPILSVFVVIFSMKCNQKMKLSKNELEYYFWAIGVYYGSTYTMYDLNIFFIHITNRMMPILLIILLNRIKIFHKKALNSGDEKSVENI